jgi:hypothetical protein
MQPPGGYDDATSGDNSPAHTTRVWTAATRCASYPPPPLHLLRLTRFACPGLIFFPVKEVVGGWGCGEKMERWSTVPRRPLAGAGALFRQNPLAAGGTLHPRLREGSGSWGISRGVQGKSRKRWWAVQGDGASPRQEHPPGGYTRLGRLSDTYRYRVQRITVW